MRVHLCEAGRTAPLMPMHTDVQLMQRRWVAVEPGQLLYYKSAFDPAPLGAYTLSA